MLFKETVTVYYQKHIHTNTFCGQNSGFFDVNVKVENIVN